MPLFSRLRRGAAFLLAGVCSSCHAGNPPGTPPPASGPGAIECGPAPRYDPAHDLGPLFPAVQLSGIFADSKTFVDARPLNPPSSIVREYVGASGHRDFDLRAFVARHFELPDTVTAAYQADSTATMVQHIESLWPVLTREPVPSGSWSSLLPLPRAYVVPGGRFREVYYWDSYFTMLGLVESRRLDLVEDMLDNFATLVLCLGRIPNGNRAYYLSRSQPPFFAAMVSLLARAADTTRALGYLAALESEHHFWMEGADRLAPGTAHRRAVRLQGGEVLNRYWDDLAEPRPESFREDYRLAQTLTPGLREAFYRNVRASAESGWDFSSRWMRDPGDLRSLETTSLIPVDLNTLLYHQERLIAGLRRFRGAPGDDGVARRYDAAAAARRETLLRLAYDSSDGWFYDVRWRSGARVADRPTLAGVLPLYFGLASESEAQAVAARLEREFLRPGGFVTSLIGSGQQWDAPNGWPPLEWMAIEGLRRYGHAALADTAAGRWLSLARKTYRATGKMMEKYDVIDTTRQAGGGEYPAQDGFGWTNGVVLRLLAPSREPVTAP